MSEAQETKFPGKLVLLGERTYVLPGLTTKQARDRWVDLQMLDKPGTTENGQERITKAVEIIHLALKRNYPDLKFEEVDDMVNVADAIPLVSMITETSGLRRTGPQPAGAEEKASSISTGQPSTELSSPAPAGPTNT